MRLADKVALITGAGSGIGRAMAQVFSKEGAKIIVADYSEEGGRGTVELVTHAGGEAVFIPVNVTDSASVQEMVRQALPAYGRIDILCNNAGVGSTQTVIDTDEATWDRVFAVDVKGVFLCSKYVLPHMIAAGKGTIMNTASVAGLTGLVNRAAYCAAKGAVVTLTKAMALDHVGQGIRVNCICPGTVDTPWVAGLMNQTEDPVATRAALVARFPMGRLAEAEEIALGALYLVSDESAYMTGSALVIDGGFLAR